jgi:glutamate synthase domain-containing protein 3
MTGGQAYVVDPHFEHLVARVNTDLVEVVRPGHADLEELRWLIERHAELTGSTRAAALLADWEQAVHDVWQILPRDRAGRIERTQRGRVVSA